MSDSPARPTALVLSPHPDDELLGCPAHLFALRDAGWRIANLALSSGREQARRAARRRELELACERAGFELLPAGDEFAIPDSRSGERVREEGLDAATRGVVALASRLGATLLVAPSPHDDHPAHEWTGRLGLAALRGGAARLLWLWGLWADVALPNSLCVFDQLRLCEIEDALAAHVGELARNDFAQLLRARAQAGAILLPERVLGYGSPGLPGGSLAEGLCAVHLGAHGELLLGDGQLLDADSLAGGSIIAAGRSASWLDLPSPRQASAS